jgi:hypothetical protein
MENWQAAGLAAPATICASYLSTRSTKGRRPSCCCRWERTTRCTKKCVAVAEPRRQPQTLPTRPRMLPSGGVKFIELYATMFPKLAVLTLPLALLPGCGRPGAVRDGPVPAQNEIVMTPGMRITAITPEGTVTVHAGKGLKRSYTVDGITRSVEMWPRDNRWYGSLGLYYSGPGNHWPEHEGISRAVVEEGQQHFQSEAEALQWLKERDWQPHVWRRDGLVVGWRRISDRKQLNVDVWQILIDGKKPDNLPGAQDDKITVETPQFRQQS